MMMVPIRSRAAIPAALLLALTALSLAPSGAQEPARLVQEDLRGVVSPGFGLSDSELHLRTRLARIDAPSLRDRDRIRLNLFSDVDLIARRRGMMHRGQDNWTWYGNVEEYPEGHVVLTVIGDAIAGAIRLDGLQYRIFTTEDGRQVVQEATTDLPWSCGTGEAHVVHAPTTLSDLAAEEPRSSGPDRPERPGSPEVLGLDDGTEIDVMVVYTPGARSRGGNMAVTIQNSIDYTNVAYENSDVTQRVNLVHTEEVEYTQYTTAGGNPDIGVDLQRLTSPNDGFIDEVHPLRNEHCADLVHLWVENPLFGVVGIAWLMGTPSQGFAPRGFGVESTRSELNNIGVLAHEMGHNMGAGHDRRTGCSFSYRCGHVPNNSAFHTIMGYGSACGNCQQAPHFSNPDVDYFSQPTGIPQGQAGAADNARGFDESAFSVANFRDSEVCTSAICSEDIYEPDNLCFSASFFSGEALRNYAHCTDASDWVRFGGTAGTTYTISTTALGSEADTRLQVTSGGDANCGFTLYEEDNSGGVAESDSVEFTPTEDGCYAVRISEVDDSFGLNRQYTLVIDGEMDATFCCTDLQEPGVLLVSRDGTLDWSGDTAASYNVYRGSHNAGAFEYSHQPLACAVSGDGHLDADNPGDSGARLFYYLISGTADCGETGLGADSEGNQRPNLSPCQ